MAKKIGIAVGAIVVVFIIYAIVARASLVRAGEMADKDWAGVAVQYKTRIALLNKFMDATKGTMTQEKKYFEDFSKSKSQYQDSKIVADQVKMVNRMEGDAQKVIVSLEKYPDLMNSEEVQSLIAQIQNDQNMSAAKKKFNDAVAIYNITIHRIRYRAASKVFGIGPKNDLRTLAELNKMATVNASIKANKKDGQKDDTKKDSTAVDSQN